MAVYVAPSSFEDLVKDYDHFIDVTIYRVSRGSLRQQDLPDIKQAVYTRLIETDYLNKYAPAKGSFSNYLYVLVRSVVANIFDKNSRAPTNMALSAIELPMHDLSSQDGLAVRGVGVVLEAHPAYQDRDFEHRMVTGDVLARLKAYAATTRDGAELIQVLDLLYQGLTRSEIAAKVGQPPGRVTQCRRKLRTILKGPLRQRLAA